MPPKKKNIASKTSSIKHNTISRAVHLRKLKRATNLNYRNKKKAQREEGDEKSIASYSQSLARRNVKRNAQRKKNALKYKKLKDTPHC